LHKQECLCSSSPNCKVVIDDTDHDCGICGSGSAGQAWAWENFTRGNGTLFMDQYLVNAPSATYAGYNNDPGPPCSDGQCTTVDPQWNNIRSAMGDILMYGNTKIDLVNMTPQDSLATEGFCLANPGSQYLVYSPSGSFTLTTVAGTYTYEWFNPSTHAVATTRLDNSNHQPILHSPLRRRRRPLAASVAPNRNAAAFDHFGLSRYKSCCPPGRA
jgi:hypothetical protein